MVQIHLILLSIAQFWSSLWSLLIDYCDQSAVKILQIHPLPHLLCSWLLVCCDQCCLALTSEHVLPLHALCLFSYNCCLLQDNVHSLGASLVTWAVKNLPVMQETQVWSLGGNIPWEEGMATHSITLTWRIPWTEEPGRLQSIGSQSSDMTEVT